jgi:hypothetical protein
LARFIDTDFLRELEALAGGPLPFPWQSDFTRMLRDALRDSSFQFPYYAGQGAPLLKHRRAIEVIHELALGLG